MPEQKPDSQTTTPQNKNFTNLIAFIVLGVIALIITPLALSNKNQPSNPQQTPTTIATTKSVNPTNTSTDSNDLDYTSLPLGDDKYSSQAQKGYVYSCQTSFNGGGAFVQGPWIDSTNNTWDLTSKISVDGSVEWGQAYWQDDISGDTRTLTSADLPTIHNTGTFPVSTSDEAYNYDRNPNSIQTQTIELQVPQNPQLAATPTCVGGEVGIATTGVLIFNAFDAGGRDAVATEIQDSCQGHPQESGYYHYHGYSSCFADNSDNNIHSDLVGYAFDGFGIYGLKGEDGKELSSRDLDECHGETHVIDWDGEEKEMYHYHMTQDFPYTVGCFRGAPAVTGLSSSGQSNSQLPNNPPPRLR